MFPWNLFPFTKEIQSKLRQMKPDEINEYIENIMKNIVPQGSYNYENVEKYMKNLYSAQQYSSNNQTKKLNYTIFETHDFVFVRIQIESESWVNQLKLFHTSHLLIIEHIPEFNDKHTIPLPSLVQKKGTSADYKDEVLEIKIPKNIDMQFTEVEVNEM